jgi:hypothetical protein
MQITITFDSATSRNAFATSTGYATADTTTLTAPGSLLGLAKASTGYVSAAQATAGSNEFIVMSEDPDGLADVCTVIANLGQGFYQVESTDFIALHTAAAGKAEPINAPIKLMSDLSYVSTVDPLSSAGQWARIRVASKFRPFSSEFSTLAVTPVRQPELIVVDSGVNGNHAEFANVTVEDFYKLPRFSTFADETGHGTAITSCAVGANVGLAVNVKVVNCKIFSGGDYPSLLELGAAMDAILARHTADVSIPRVVNMSWNTPKSAYLDAKIDALIQAGMIVVAAAGNDGIDVANLTPAGKANVITVAASDIDDVAAGFNDFAAADSTITTNAGQYLDFFAPGVLVAVARYNGGYGAANGSSFSAGFASGAVAQLMALIPTWPQNFTTMIQLLSDDSTKGVLLLDPDKFSENQNRVIHLFNGVNTNDLAFDYYLGAFTADVPTIEGDMSQILNVPFFDNQTVNYSIIWDDATLGADYASFVTINNETGVFAVTKPTVSLPSDVNFKLITFKIRATTDTIVKDSNNLIFFTVNPAYDGDISTDLASALEDLNSQSFFAAWVAYSLK